MLAVSPVVAASSRPSATVDVCLVSSTTIRLTFSWQHFDADGFVRILYHWAPRSTVGGEPKPLDVPGTSGQQILEITVDPSGDTGPTQTEFDSWDRGFGQAVADSTTNPVFGPSDSVRRPRAGWPACP
jgi:hypothetical protein